MMTYEFLRVGDLVKRTDRRLHGVIEEYCLIKHIGILRNEGCKESIWGHWRKTIQEAKKARGKTINPLLKLCCSEKGINGIGQQELDCRCGILHNFEIIERESRIEMVLTDIRK